MPLRIRDEHGELTAAAGEPETHARSTSASSGGVTAGFASQLVDSVRQIIMSYGPVAPRTAIECAEPLVAHVEAGALSEITFLVKNRQNAVGLVNPRLTPAHSDSGACWTPVHQIEVERRILMAFEAAQVTLKIDVPQDIAPGTYTASLRMLGVSGSVPLALTVRSPDV